MDACGNHHEIAVQLAEYGEKVVATQRIGRGPAYWEFWAAFDGVSYSVVIVGRGDIACVYAVGGSAQRRAHT